MSFQEDRRRECGVAEKYNYLAEGFAERTWANLAFDMRRRFTLATTWGKALHLGDSVVEFGCGDGYLAQLFVQEWFPLPWAGHISKDGRDGETATFGGGADGRFFGGRYRVKFL